MLTSRIHHNAVICATVCALLAFALTGVAPASANERTQAAGALAQERYYSTFGEPGMIDAGTSAALAQERYTRPTATPSL